MKTVLDIPPDRRNIRYLRSLLRYEEEKGIHTYHGCDCGMSKATRSGICSDCLRGMIQEVNDGIGTDNKIKFTPIPEPKVPDGIYDGNHKRNLDNSA